jgi:hypothetical protein
VTDIRQFKLVIGPPKVTLNKPTEQYVYRLDKPDPDEALRGELLHDTQSRLAKQYDHHLLNQDGKTVYPQAPNPYPFSFASKEFNRPVEAYDDTISEKHFLEIHLGDWLDGDDPLCYFLLLAHVTDPDLKDDASDNSKTSEEQKTGTLFQPACLQTARWTL